MFLYSVMYTLLAVPLLSLYEILQLLPLCACLVQGSLFIRINVKFKTTSCHRAQINGFSDSLCYVARPSSELQRRGFKLKFF